jgi:tRNA threonylcarbamoyladenosine biosynthesis protein TsaE
VKIEVLTLSEKETQDFGKKLGKLLRPGDLILLYGDLGSGKTTFVKGIAEGIEVNPEVYITSPTFSLVNIYEGKYTLYHIDLYRISFEEAVELGIWEFLSDGIVVIEWADKLEEIPKEDFLEVVFEFLEDSKRKVVITGYGEWKELLKELDRDALLCK